MASSKKKAAGSPKIVVASPLDLLLDKRNPRLTDEEQGGTQDKLRAVLHERFKLVELGRSIAASGYLPFDPLIGAYEGNKVVVLEGNRRIAALQMLLEPGHAPKRHQDIWKELAGELTPAGRRSIQSVDVTVYPSRTGVDVSAYIGFRHVTSVLKWPALEKAAYIARLIDEQGWSYADVADKLGSYPKHVEKHYVAYRIVQQAKDKEIPGSDNLEHAFGVLQRAMQAGGVTDFLGIDYPNDPRKSKLPVPSDKQENFNEFVAWTFGTDDQERILRESRDLTKWGKILGEKSSLRYLRTASRPTLQRAWSKSGGEVETLADTLYQAASRLEESVPLVKAHASDSDVTDAVGECTRFLSQILEHFPAAAKEHGVTVD